MLYQSKIMFLRTVVIALIIIYSLILCKNCSNKPIWFEITKSDSKFCKTFATDFVSGEIAESMRHVKQYMSLLVFCIIHVQSCHVHWTHQQKNKRNTDAIPCQSVANQITGIYNAGFITPQILHNYMKMKFKLDSVLSLEPAKIKQRCITIWKKKRSRIISSCT